MDEDMKTDETVTEEPPTPPSGTTEETVLEDDFVDFEGDSIETPDLGGRFNPNDKAVEENKKTFKDIFTDVLAKVKVSLGLDEETLQAKREEREAKDIAKQAKVATKKGEYFNYDNLDELTKIKIDALTTALFNGNDGEFSELTFRHMTNMAVNLIEHSGTNADIDKVFKNVVDEFQNTKSAKKLQKLGLLNVDSAIQLSEKLGSCNTSEEVLNSTVEHLYGIKRSTKEGEPFNYDNLDELAKIKIDALTTALLNGRDGDNSGLTFRNTANMAAYLVFQSNVDNFKNTKSAKELQKLGLLDVDSAIELSKRLRECKNSEEVLSSTAEYLYGIKVKGIEEKQFSVIGLANAEVERITIPQELCGKKLWRINLSHEYNNAQNLKTIDVSKLDCFTWYNAAELLFLRTSSDMKQFVTIKCKDKEVSLAKIEADVDISNTIFEKSNIYMQDEPEPAYFDSKLYTNGSPSFVSTFRRESIEIPSAICNRTIVVTDDFFKRCENFEGIQITAPVSMKNNLEKALENRLSELRDNGNEIGNVAVTAVYDDSRVTYGFSESGNLTMKVENVVRSKQPAEQPAKTVKVTPSNSVLIREFVSGDSSACKVPTEQKDNSQKTSPVAGKKL